MRRFIAELNKAGDQPGTIRNTFNVVRLVMGTAVGSGAIRVNACTGVRIPKSSRDEMLFLAPEEVLALARAITEDFRVLVLFAGIPGSGRARSAPCEWAGSTCCAGASM